MNRFLREKFIAFTLAEMMVILALFSTIAAATLPVVTARRALDVSELATGGSTLDPWTYSSAYNGISYYNSQSSLLATSAVMVGGQVSADAKSIGYPQLIVKNNYIVPSGINFGRHIVFLKRSSNNNTYLGGSIMMGNRGEGSIAIGANAMTDVASNVDKSRSVAIGSYSMYGNSSSANYLNSVAIGYSNIYAIQSVDNTVAIGYKNCYTTTGSSSLNVCIGSNNAQNYNGASVQIGKNVTFGANSYLNVALGTKSLVDSAGVQHSVVIGYDAYAYTGSGYKDGLVSIGSYAGYASNAQKSVLLGNRTQTKYSESVVIGNYATANSSNSSRSNAVVIGNYAGYGYNYKNVVPILIGPSAGRASGISNSAAISSNNISYPVIIGLNAFLRAANSATNAPDVVIGSAAAAGGNSTDLRGTIIIGNSAATNSKTLTDSICIGSSTCLVVDAKSVVRLAPYGYYSKTLGEYASHIGMPTMLENLDSANKEKFLGNSYSNMLITPAITSSDLATSSILFYANTVYGPSTTFTSFSDKRLKENIKPAKYGLNDIKKINIYEYNLKDESINKRQIGVIAQEMKEVIPEGVKQLPSGYYTVSADWLIFPMVNAIKELDKTFVSLKSDLTKYFNEYIVLVSRVKTLEKEVKNLERENKSLTKEVSIAYKKAKLAERRQ